MPRAGPRTVHRYSMEFKLTAVRLTEQPGIQVQTVAQALAIHPFMLSKWRKDAREGKLRGSVKKAPPAGPAREIAKLQKLEKAHAILKEEHDLLKKAIRFCSARKADQKQTSLPSSTRSVRPTA
jgi:transposase